jgi:ribosome-associated toxin RatA of RatAB toxin-antitoxin module
VTPSIKVTATLPPGTDPRAAYDRVTRFDEYPRHCPDVQRVTVERDPETEAVVSNWDVNFRGGTMRWRERDSFDETRLIAQFDQIEGDLNEFHGHWQIRSDDTGVTVEFFAYYDVGIATLAEFLNPVAGRALSDNIVSIITALYGPTTEVSIHDTAASSAQ